MTGVYAGPDDADFFARPRANHVRTETSRGAGPFLGHRGGIFHHRGDAGRVVVGAGVDLAFLARAIQRTALAVTQVVVVRADDDGLLVILGAGR